MSYELVMPRLADSMEEGLVACWLRSDGDWVTRGESIVEIDTDKATLTLEADTDGVLHILVPAGSSARTGEAIALIGLSADAVANKVKEKSVSIAVASDEQASLDDRSPVHSTEPKQHDLEPSLRVIATPVARKLVRQAGIELASLFPGSGPDGRIHMIDVERNLARLEESATTRAAAKVPSKNADALVEPTRIQAVVARRMAEAKREVPHYYLTTEVDVSKLNDLRDSIDDLDVGVKVTVSDFVLLSCARALRTVPEVNASWSDGRIIQRGSANIGLAVALDDGGLVVPVVKDADRKTLYELAAETRQLIERARSSGLSPADIEGGTFTVSNLGMFGITEFHAIVNPPESGILAVGATIERVVPQAGSIVVRPIMSISLSADHRVYSGATAARFLGAIRRSLENASELL